MKRILVVVSVMSLSLTAFAGKAERDAMEKKVVPAVKAATEKFNASCGCPLKITVDETTIKSTNDMSLARYMAEHVTAGAPKYCTDDASKKAVCQMKTLTLAKAAKSEFTFKDGAGLCTTDGQSSCSWEQMTRVLDK